MSLNMKDEGGSFTPAPAGNHLAICYAVIDLGTQHQDAFQWEGATIVAKDVPQVLFMWELPNEMVDVDGQQQPAVISQFYNAYFSEKAKLRLHLEAWRGRAFTAEELNGFDIGNVVGKPCMLNVIHNEKGKAKITSVSALPKGMNVPELFNKSFTFDLSEYNQEVFDNISEGIQRIIKRSAEWQQNDFESPQQVRRDYEPETFTDDSIPF